MELARHLQPVADDLLHGLRAVVVNGPRQAGKSTLVRHLQSGRGDVVNLDDPSLRDLARRDPIGFIAQLPTRVAIDEFQRGGDDLLLALKMALDRASDPGQFLLAGSTRFLTTQRLTETLTGRIGLLDLLPLSAGELRSTRETFIDRVFANPSDLERAEVATRADYARMIVTGGFPELAVGESTPRIRAAWCSAYLRTVTAAANLEHVGPVRRPEALRALIQQAALRSAHEVVIADLARELTIDESTVRTYLAVLETLYLVRLVPGWSTSRTNRAKRRPVIHLIDTALTTHVIGATAEQLTELESPWFGPLLESFVVGEIAKQVSWNEAPVAISQYRDRDGREVDVILEQGQNVVGIEVKATSTPTTGHARHLVYLRDRIGERFRCGVVLHTGRHVLRLSDRIVAAPVSALWS